MIKLKTLIVDDEPIALAKLHNYVDRIDYLDLCGACSSASEALPIISRNDIQLLITDICMPDLSGMEMIESLNNPPMVILTTAYTDYAVESYRMDVVDYLLKPFSFSEFYKASEKAYKRFQSSESQLSVESEHENANDGSPLFVKVDYRYIRVNPHDILYIKGFGEYLQIYVKGEEKSLLTLSSFRMISQKLPEKFLQVHRSYIVNLAKADQIFKAKIILEDGTEIPIGDSFKSRLQKYLSNHSIIPLKKE